MATSVLRNRRTGAGPSGSATSAFSVSESTPMMLSRASSSSYASLSRGSPADEPSPLSVSSGWIAPTLASSSSSSSPSSTLSRGASSAVATSAISSSNAGGALVLAASPLYVALCQLLSSSASAVSTLLADLVSAVLADAARLGHAQPGASPTLPPLSDDAYRVLEESRRAAHHAFVREDAACERELARLWSLSCPDTPLEARVSKQWKSLGFQGTDPASDLRGPTGLVQLRLLVWVAEQQPALYAELQRNAARRDVDFFPVAIASCNLSNVLFELLGFGMRPTPSSTPARIALSHLLAAEVARATMSSSCSSSASSPSHCLLDDKPLETAAVCPPSAGEAALRTLGALQSMLLTLLQDEWLASQATYMQFNAVLATVRGRFERMLVSVVATHGPTTVECAHLWAALKHR